MAARQSLIQRGMAIDPIRPLCGVENESVLHMLVRCDDSKHLWYISPLCLEIEKYEGASFGEWCVSFRRRHKDRQWWSLFLNLVWGIWLRRNAWVFEGWKEDVAKVIYKAVVMEGEYALAQQDDVGDVVASTCLPIHGKFDADIAEAIAMRHALSIAIDSGFRNVCVETNCFKLHSHLIKWCARATAFGSTINDIIQLSRSCHSYCFSFVKRNDNRVAHALAKLYSSFDSLRVWMEEVPSNIAEIVLADLRLLID
ncbi:uncharacterized protein LOC110697547 [Chenopodium quinoa]|uniref:RNase H type-1 domain-containing protein n=1 Tax=Chenopodium quinoa TaxID=63459 RepID=A0A803N700_CHEQI|nr:uncharacterized protein LOC110697547 [Chenopodium quinoa]